MSKITVIFDINTDQESRTEPDYPITVENIEEHIKEKCNQHLQTISPEVAITEALEIIDSAPSFDHVDANEINPNTHSVEVAYNL